MSSLFYHYLDVNMGSAAKALAWAHLVLMNVGASTATSMMIYGGYQAGAAMLPLDVGGRGLDAEQAHSTLAPFVLPIGASIMAILAGVVTGGAGFLMACRRKQSEEQKSARPPGGTRRTDTDTEAALQDSQNRCLASWFSILPFAAATYDSLVFTSRSESSSEPLSERRLQPASFAIRYALATSVGRTLPRRST